MINLYKFHTNPKSLFGYAEAMTKVPALVWQKYKNDPDQLRKYEPILARDPEYAYWYAAAVLRKRWPQAEPMIATSSKYSLYYAQNILNGPFPAGEAAIATDPVLATSYAVIVLNKPWPQAEKIIAQNPQCLLDYESWFGIK